MYILHCRNVTSNETLHCWDDLVWASASEYQKSVERRQFIERWWDFGSVGLLGVEEFFPRGKISGERFSQSLGTLRVCKRRNFDFFYQRMSQIEIYDIFGEIL